MLPGFHAHVGRQFVKHNQNRQADLGSMSDLSPDDGGEYRGNRMFGHY